LNPAAAQIQGLGRLGDGVRGNPNFAADLLEIGERQTLIAGKVERSSLRPLGGCEEDSRDLFVIVSSIGHDASKIAATAVRGNPRRR